MKPIVTKKCTLRAPSLRDVDAIARYAHDKTIARNTAALPYPYTTRDARTWITRCQRRNRAAQPTGQTWLIEVGGEAVGAISLMSIKSKHKAELGYWLGKPFRGQGIMPAAIRGVLRYAKNTLHLQVVYAFTYTYNPSSGRALQKAGFTKRGTLVQFSKKDGRYVDDIIYMREL